MIHPASHLTLTVFSRSDGHSAVAAAAYRARTSFVDHRRGRRYTYRSLGGLLSNEIIGWSGSGEDLWNGAEAAETRGNARVARELRPALPAELPLAEQIRLVRGMCLWLRDRYGVASQAAIHAPTFHVQERGKIFWKGVAQSGLSDDDLSVLSDPATTNLNFHAHILFTTRRVDPETGAFLEKTRALDDRKQGPAELKIIRTEWEKRTNAALAKSGIEARIDMRSYADMAAAGDAPVGMLAQDHLGPRRSARSRRHAREGGQDDTIAGRRRQAIREHNEEVWASWLQLRALQREKAREEESARIAAAREAERRSEAAAARKRLRAVTTQEEAEAALAAAHHLDSLLKGDPLAKAIAAAQSKDPSAWPPEPSSEPTIDLETFEPEPPPPASRKPVLQPRRVRVRTRVRVR